MLQLKHGGNDTSIRVPGTLDALVDYMDAHPACAAAGPRIVGPVGLQQGVGEREEWPAFGSVFVGGGAGFAVSLIGAAGSVVGADPCSGTPDPITGTPKP